MAKLLPEQLLQQANYLLTDHPLHASQADLRRAVSAAYYGIFHLVCRDAADLFCGKMQRDKPDYTIVYRSLDHGQLRRICKAVQAPNLENAIGAMLPEGRFVTQLVQFAAITAELQDARNRADYDPAVFEPAVAQARVRSARDAFALYQQVVEARPAINRSVFLTLLMFKKRP